MERDGLAAPLIGRHLELEALNDRLKGARAGRSGVVLIRGAPGVGKSRLLAEAMDQARLLGFRVLHGRADELDRGTPYASLRDALGSALAAETNPLLEPLAAEVQRALSHSGSPVTASLVEASGPSRAAFAAGDRLLRAWADREPVLLALDDLHVADEDTLTVVSLLARTLQDTRVLLAGTLRSDPPDLTVELAALVERLTVRDDVTLLNIGALDDDDVRALAASRLGAGPDDGLTRVLVEMTRGNPFFVEELLRAYRDAGAIEIVAGRSRLASEMPQVSLTTRSTLLARVFALGPDVRSVARVVTAFQRLELERLDLVADLTRLDAAQVERAFDVLVRARILNPLGDRGYEFAHPIVRSTLDEDLGPAERRRIHRFIADRLLADRKAGGSVDVLELATHLLHAADRGDAEAAAVFAEAGDLTVTSAPRSAADWYAQALLLIGEGDDSRGALLGRRARALFLAQRKGEAADAAREAVALLPRGRARERAAVVLAASLSALGRMDEALDVTDTLIASAGEAPPRLLAERATLLVQLDRFQEAEATANRALDAAGDGQSRALARAALAQAAFAQGRMTEALALMDAAVDDGGATSVRVARASYLAFAGLCPAAEIALAEADAEAALLGGLAYRTTLDPAAVWALGLAGRWDEALERAHLATLEFERSGELFLLSLLRTMEAWILFERGELRMADEVLAAVADSPSSRSARAWVRGGIDLALGHLDAARDGLEVALAVDRATGRRSVSPQLLERLIEVELQADHREAAADHLSELEGVAVAIDTPWARALALRGRARVTGDAGAARESIVAATGAGLRFEVAVSEVVLGECDAVAVDELRHAYVEFRDLGAPSWSRRAGALLRGRGLSPPRRRRAPTDGLSITERQLARLVADGLTNREIASVMHFSPKTVEVYLSRLYVKTACSSRTELAVAVQAGTVDISDPGGPQ